MLTVVAIIGCIIGSFLSVCIYRIPISRPEWATEIGLEPRKSADPSGKTVTIASPARSFCPSCNATLRWWHNIPLLSWLMLGGKCGHCKAPISIRYPLIEIMSTINAVASFSHFGLTPTGVVVFIFVSALIVISFIDFDYYIIPDVISLSGTAIAIVIALINEWTHFFAPPVVPGIRAAGLGLLAGAGFLYTISWFYLRIRKRDGLGLGDVKLLAMTGILFGPEAALYTIFLGSLFGSFLGIVLVILGGRSFSQHLPFGPYLAVGTVLYIFSGNTILELIMSLIIPKM